MHNKRFRFILSMAATLALLAGLLPMAFSTAMENSKASTPECPPMDASLTQNPSFIKSLPAKCRAELHKKGAPQQTLLAQSLLLATGGPDNFGYTYDDTLPVNWISPSFPGLTGDDGYIGRFGLGFTFPFYGANYTDLFINFNGLLTFDQGVCCVYGGTTIPNSASPNNLIAPFWEDLVLGAPYNTGGLFYGSDGVAPNRYFVAEWRDVTTYAGSDPFSFEVVLYENGDILFQYQSLPASSASTVGIENATGDDGLGYQGISAPKAIKFFYPSGPMARVSVSPLSAGKFASASADTNFPIQIKNIGSAGTDTYNLSATSTWPVNLYQDGCITPLTDTNADTVIDTGPLLEGTETTVCVSFSAPGGSTIGDDNSGVLTVASSIDPTKTKDATFSMVIPASFMQVFEDYSNAAMAFQANGPEGPTTTFVTNDFYFANGPAMIRMPDGRYLYAWRKPDGNFQDAHSNIEFTLLNADGSFDLPVTQLTNNFGMGQTYDYSPAVAVAPNGNIGVIWYRWLVDGNTNTFNYNIYFAMLSANGTVLYPPSNVTNNTLWDAFNDLNVPHFFSPAIAATGDNRFVLGWQDFRSNGSTIFKNDILFSIRDSNGTNLFNPTLLTSDGSSVNPILNPLTGNQVILSYATNLQVAYFILDSSGVSSSSHAVPNGSAFQSTDAVMLPNGRTALAWATTGPDIGYVLLDAAYNIAVGPVFAANPAAAYNRDLSVTYDEANRIVMTWADDEAERSTKLFYALADDTGTFLNTPTLFRSSAPGLLASVNGQGNAPIITAPQSLEVAIDIKPGSDKNPINTRSYGVIPVAILSAPDFDANAMTDQTSLTFGKTGDEASLKSCDSLAQDVNTDGLPDLICHFRVPLMGFSLGDTAGILKGMTVENVPFEGSDTLIILK